MPSKERHEFEALSPWRSTPARYIVIFLLAVFFVFASVGFVLDAIDMGSQPILRLAVTVVLIGLFSTAYAATGITLRQRWWRGCLPLFVAQNVCFWLLHRWLPDGPPITQLGPADLGRFQNRLTFDGVAIIISVVLGYVGFVVVSIAESRRRIRLEFEKATIEGELAAAHEIQRLMVPDEVPPAPGYKIESIYRPAAQVGGDFFQVIPLHDGQTLVIIGDVSGKGLSAAMIVSMLIGTLRTISNVSQEPSQILVELNRMLIEHKHSGFVTCLAVRLDASGQVALANAGHLPPWLNGVEVACAGSVPLSLVASAAPEEASLVMHPGDRLTLLTDGLVEARDPQGILFGFDRTEALIRQRASALALAQAAVDHGQKDDLTVISIVRTA